MSAPKVIRVFAEGGGQVQVAVVRESDGRCLDAFTGEFKLPVDASPYLDLVDHPLIGLYVLTESRKRWPDGRYLVLPYWNAGAPNPATATILAAQVLEVRSDKVAGVNDAADAGALSAQVAKTESASLESSLEQLGARLGRMENELMELHGRIPMAGAEKGL